MQVLIRQAKIVDPRSEFHGKVVDLLVENGNLKDIAANITAKADQTIEADGLCVSPGWIDLFADYAEPGYEQKETIKTGLAAAAAGGFTKVLLAPNTNPVVSTASVVNSIKHKAEGNFVTALPLGSISQDIEGKNLSEMLDMHTHGAVAFTDGWKPVQNANLFLKALEYVKAFDGILVQIPVDKTLSEGGLMHEGPVSTRLGMAGIPTLSETLIVHRDIELLRYTNSKLHITGVSSAESVEMIRKAKAEGLNITCSVTPYHLLLNDESLMGYSSMYKVMPPLRSEQDRQALIAGLKDGTIDCIASHHRPQEWDAKAKEFEYASNGMNVQEITFNLALQALGKENLDVIIKALSENPAKIFGFEQGSIAKGNKTSLTLFSINGSTQLNSIMSKSKNNPFIGNVLAGSIIGIINNNQTHLNK